MSMVNTGFRGAPSALLEYEAMTGPNRARQNKARSGRGLGGADEPESGRGAGLDSAVLGELSLHCILTLNPPAMQPMKLITKQTTTKISVNRMPSATRVPVVFPARIPSITPQAMPPSALLTTAHTTGKSRKPTNALSSVTTGGANSAAKNGSRFKRGLECAVESCSPEGSGGEV